MLDHPAAGLPLAVHGVCRDCFAFNIQIVQHFLDDRYLVCLLVDGLLTQNNAAADYIGAQYLQGTEQPQ